MKKISFGNKTKNGKKGGRKGKKLLLILILLLVVILGVYAAVRMKAEKAASANVKEVRTATVETRDITSELSSSGTISPKNTYDITSLVEGEVIAADFEEGDQVEAGQILYQIDTSSMESELTSVNNSLTRAQENYEVALDDYNTALSDYSGNTYKSTEAGYIRTLYIKEGDKVSSNTKIADIYDDKVMKIKLPFLSGEAAFIGAGSADADGYGRAAGGNGYRGEQHGCDADRRPDCPVRHHRGGESRWFNHRYGCDGDGGRLYLQRGELL